MPVRTIEDMETLNYSPLGVQYVQKDAPHLTTTTGIYNAVYGQMVWFQLNTEANAFGALPKYPWLQSGWRAITARAATSGGGVGEGGTIPDTIKHTFAELSTKPKTIAHTFDSSEIQHFLASESADDVFGSMEQLRPLYGTHHREMINVMLLDDVETVADNASANYTGTNNMESLDRVIANDTEEDNYGDTFDDNYDIYGIDRDDSSSSATTWADAYVDENNTTDRSLTNLLIRTMLENIREAGGNTTFMLTGHDTYASIQGIYDSYVRYNPLGKAKVSLGVNGIQTATGINVGIDIPSVHNIPLIVSKDTTKDTISRIYAVDTSDPEGYGKPRLGIMIAKPTQYFEAGMNTGNPFAINKISSEGMYRTAGEIICRFFKSQGKLRDLL